MTNRREFFQTTAAIAGSFILPASLFATPSSNFHFLHVDSYKDWPLTDPVQWFLQNAYEPILARAAEGLAKLTQNEGDRIIRLAEESSLPTHASEQCVAACRYLATVLAALIHGEDRDEVLSPDWKPLKQLNDIRPLHPLIQEIAGSSRNLVGVLVRVGNSNF